MNKFLFYFLFSFFNQVSSIIYQVKSLNSLKKSLRILDEDNAFLQEVKGDSNYLNYYYTTLYLGKDKSPQVYILDTGSSITTSPCDKCTSCGQHLNQKYKLEDEKKIITCDSDKCNLLSNTKCISNQCSFHTSYAEGSKISGFYLNEDVYFETIDSENNITNISYNIPLGCTTKETHLFQTQLADGIMGLNNNDKSFVSILYRSKVIQKNIFSLCFSHEGGYFSIGKLATSHHFSKNISYVNLLNRNMGNYFINLNYIQIGDTKVQYNGKAFVDSGTTITYLPNNKFEEIMKGFLEICKSNKKCGNLRRIKSLGYCAKLNDETEINDIISLGWSNIIFVFDSYEFKWTPENYFFIYNTEANGLNICLGFDGDKRQNVLLGTTFMHGYDIIFDKDKYRMGFVPADCNRNEKIEKKEEDDNNIIINDINNLDNNNEENKNDTSNKIITNINTEINTDINNDIKTEIKIDMNSDINNEINKLVTNKDISEINKIKKDNNIYNNELNNETNKIIDIKIDDIHLKERLVNISNISNYINLTNINEINIPKNIITNNNNSIKQNGNKNQMILEKNKISINERINFDKFIIKFSMFFSLIIFILFIIFNIILFRENYIYIQNRKNDNSLNKYELEIPKEDSNNPMSFFNDV